MHTLTTPLLLIPSFLLFAASAVPVSSLELTPDTFAQTTEKGLWFVEHYSPYCGHCKHFKPTWDQLYVEAQTEIPEVSMATVNCIMYGDLCSKNGIELWPTMLMFEDGKIVDQFKGSREMDKLKSFMKRHVKDQPLPDPASAPESTSTSTPAAPIISDPKPKPPTQPPAALLNPTGEVLPLTSDTFTSTLSKGPAFVKFFAPWCGHCKKLAPTWKQLAKHMQGKVTVAEVNCDDHAALCKSQDVGGYPTLIWYASGDVEGGRTEYTSGRKLEQLKAFAEKASAAGVEVLEKDEDLKTRVMEEDVVYLLLHSDSDPNILSTIRDASAPLLGSPKILASSSPTLKSQFGIPPSTSPSDFVLLSLKDHDPTLPSSTFYSTPSVPPSSDPKLRKWLLSHRLPTVVELTRDTFQGVMNAPQQPLVVLALAGGELRSKVLERLRDLGRKWRVRTDGSGVVRGREVVFAFMDGGEWKDWLGSMYGVVGAAGEGLEGTKVVIADHNKLIYYDTDRDEKPINFMVSTSMFGAINDAAAGASKYKHSESFVERIARTLNASVLSLESYIFEKPFHVIFFVLIGAGVLFYVVNRYVGGDARGAAGGREEWVQQKGKNGRLD